MEDKIKKILEKYKVYGAKQDLMTEELLVLFNVSQQRELLLAYNEEVNQCMVDSQDLLNESDVDEFMANNCG